MYVLSKAEGGSATLYVLAGPSESDFSDNVNKKIEVTGPVQEPPNADKDSAPAANVGASAGDHRGIREGRCGELLVSCGLRPELIKTHRWCGALSGERRASVAVALMNR